MLLPSPKSIQLLCFPHVLTRLVSHPAPPRSPRTPITVISTSPCPPQIPIFSTRTASGPMHLKELPSRLLRNPQPTHAPTSPIHYSLEFPSLEYSPQYISSAPPPNPFLPHLLWTPGTPPCYWNPPRTSNPTNTYYLQTPPVPGEPHPLPTKNSTSLSRTPLVLRLRIPLLSQSPPLSPVFLTSAPFSIPPAGTPTPSPRTPPPSPAPHAARFHSSRDTIGGGPASRLGAPSASRRPGDRQSPPAVANGSSRGRGGGCDPRAAWDLQFPRSRSRRHVGRSPPGGERCDQAQKIRKAGCSGPWLQGSQEPALR